MNDYNKLWTDYKKNWVPSKSAESTLELINKSKVMTGNALFGGSPEVMHSDITFNVRNYILTDKLNMDIRGISIKV
ncbi:hypothetical protein EHO98_19190 [Leptospira stimsonii]|uniref:Uncharacterized protein n=1 Tax=Leptospira stimsonii TaxID=2202203 RepID=A0ABY2MWP8_9LEPT|nr:hypothetical protein EHO98_19190 [Leptospira stimsonii]TGM10141.1 hypothetical protein EHQ90_19555 [Leptospira stimsonii]